MTTEVDGYVLLDKPVGMSSQDAVHEARRTMGLPGGRRGTKVGHAGTLDPFASGLLVMLVGRATRLMPWVVGHDKRYEVGVLVGAGSTTDDLTGDVVAAAAVPTADGVRAGLGVAARDLLHRTMQRPPSVSALHVDGDRAYRRVRRGEEVVIPERAVRYDAIDVRGVGEVAATDTLPQGVLVELDVVCASGTYMRSLARDLGGALGSAGLAATLRRTVVGTFDVAAAVAPDAATVSDVRPMIDLLDGMRRVEVSPTDAGWLVDGRRIPQVGEWPEGVEEQVAVTCGGSLCAVARARRGLHGGAVLAPKVVVWRRQLQEVT